MKETSEDQQNKDTLRPSPLAPGRPSRVHTDPAVRRYS